MKKLILIIAITSFFLLPVFGALNSLKFIFAVKEFTTKNISETDREISFVLSWKDFPSFNEKEAVFILPDTMEVSGDINDLISENNFLNSGIRVDIDGDELYTGSFKTSFKSGTFYIAGISIKPSSTSYNYDGYNVIKYAGNNYGIHRLSKAGRPFILNFYNSSTSKGTFIFPAQWISKNEIRLLKQHGVNMQVSVVRQAHQLKTRPTEVFTGYENFHTLSNEKYLESQTDDFIFRTSVLLPLSDNPDKNKAITLTLNNISKPCMLLINVLIPQGSGIVLSSTPRKFWIK